MNMENPIILLYAGLHVMIYFNNVKRKIEFYGCPLKNENEKKRRRKHQSSLFQTDLFCTKGYFYSSNWANRIFVYVP